MMKLVFSIAIISCSFLAQAQIKFGALVGFNHNMPKYETLGDSLNNQTVSGKSFSGGLFGSYELHDNFELMAELLISGRHHNSTLIVENSKNGLTFYEEHFSSVGTVNFELPILASVKKDFRKGRYGDKKTISGFAGPVFMMHLSDSYYRSSDRKSTRLNSSHVRISYAVFCLKKKKKKLITYSISSFFLFFFFFFFNDTATTEIYTLSLHDALPICVGTVNFELPILASVKKDFRKGRYGDKKTISGFAGPVFMMHLSDSYYRSSGYRKTVYNQESIETEELTESPIDYRGINLGFIAGVQYEFAFGLRAGVRFQTNFMDENTNTNFSIRYSQLQLNLGYTIFK